MIRSDLTMDDSIPRDDIPKKCCTRCKKIKVLDDFPNLDKRTNARLPVDSRRQGSNLIVSRVKENILRHSGKKRDTNIILR